MYSVETDALMQPQNEPLISGLEGHGCVVSALF